jgi:ketosteroid isomerase-like protein
MEPREVVRAWVDAFNRADVEMLAGMYSEDAINHQVAEDPVVGQAAIRGMFVNEFARAKMVCIVENIFQDGEWAFWSGEIRLACEAAGSSILSLTRSCFSEATGTDSPFCGCTGCQSRSARA